MKRLIICSLMISLTAGATFAASRRQVTESFQLEGETEVMIEMKVGELAIEVADTDQVEVELDLRCRSRSATCERRLERVEVVEERRSGRLRVRFDGIGKTSTHKMEVDAVVRIPRQVELAVDMGVGELDITGTEHDVFVDMGIGEVRLWLTEEAVGSVFLDTGIGESSLYGARADSSRSFLIGSELEWEDGSGESEVVVDLGIGEISVHLD